MKYQVTVINQDKGETTVDVELFANSKREILLLLADNLGESLAPTNIQIGIREVNEVTERWRE